MLNIAENVWLFLVDAVSFFLVCGIYLGFKSSTSLPIYSEEFVKNDVDYMVSIVKCIVWLVPTLPYRTSIIPNIDIAE